jgi:antitoxin Phd
MKNIWQLQDAKSKFSEVIDQALMHGAQIVTRRGKKTVVVLPFDEYERLTKRSGSLTQFLLDSPLAGLDLPIERDQRPPRPVDIEP